MHAFRQALLRSDIRLLLCGISLLMLSACGAKGTPGSGFLTGDPDIVASFCNSPWLAPGSYCSSGDGGGTPAIFTTRPTCGNDNDAGIVDACGVAITAVDLHDPVVMTMRGLDPNTRYLITIEDSLATDVTGGGYIAMTNGDGEINKKTIVQNMAELPGSELGLYTVKVNSLAIPATAERTVTYTVEDRSRVQCRNTSDNPQASFLTSDSVRITVLQNTGTIADGTYKVYVRSDLLSAIASGINLGTATTTINITGGTGTKDIALASYTVGAYDVIVDINNNGVFNQGTDLISRQNRLHPCFVVQNTGGVLVQQIASDKNGNSRNIFDSNANIAAIRDIQATITPKERSAVSTPGKVRTYLVSHRAAWTGGEALNHVDATDDYKTTPVQNDSNSEAPWIVTPYSRLSPLATLDPTVCYDVVVDTDGNGVFDAGTDYVDNIDHVSNTTCGVRISNPACTNVSITSHADGTYLPVETAITLEGSVLGLPSKTLVTVAAGSQSSTVEFTVDGTGKYSFALPLFAGANHITVSGIYADNSTCSKTITINRPENVALFRAQLTWDGDTDMDLHLVKPGGTYSNGGGGDGSDCNWTNCKVGLDGSLAPNPIDWGVAEEDSDDPRLDVDCVSCFNGVENIWMDYISEDGSYKIYVDAYTGTETGDGGAVPVLVKIYILGTEVATVDCTAGTNTLSEDAVTPPVADSCFVGTIKWTGGSAGSGIFIPDGSVAGDF